MVKLMAEYKVRAVRVSDDKYRIELVIHGNQVVAKSKLLEVIKDKKYEKLFESTKSIIKK